jgi:hypothetical protein
VVSDDSELTPAPMAMENFRQANRRVASVEACQASAESPDAERDRSKSALVVNATWMTQAAKEK